MKKTKHIPFFSLLLASLVPRSSTMAQTAEDQRTETVDKYDTRSIDAISAARTRYTQTADISPDASNPTLAQLRAGPGRPFPSQRPYPRGTYQTPWRDHANAGHILIGAAIGFCIGAALGAHNSARDGTPGAGEIVIGGGLLAVLGGCAGKAVGDLQSLHYASVHRIRNYRPSGPGDDEVSTLASHPNTKETQPGAPAAPASPGQLAVLRPGAP